MFLPQALRNIQSQRLVIVTPETNGQCGVGEESRIFLRKPSSMEHMEQGCCGKILAFPKQQHRRPSLLEAGERRASPNTPSSCHFAMQ